MMYRLKSKWSKDDQLSILELFLFLLNFLVENVRILFLLFPYVQSSSVDRTLEINQFWFFPIMIIHRWTHRDVID